MGEYVNYRGRDIKLGTCEDLYYVRHEQMAEIVANSEFVPGNLPPREYVKPGNVFRYRFPFPEEDGIGPGEFKDYDKGLLLAVPPDAPIHTSDHLDKWVPVNVGGGAYNVNVCVPCPASGKLQASGLKHSPIPSTFPVEIVQQRLVESGELWTVCRCGWCGTRYRLPREEAEWLANYLNDYASDDRAEYYREVGRRILAGYAVPATV